MTPTTKTLIATVATLFALSAGAANAQSPLYGFHPAKIDINGSFNNSNTRNTQIDNSKRAKINTHLNYDLDNSVRYKLNNSVNHKLRYDVRKNHINANQDLKSKRYYNSSVGQNAANVGGASGHSMKQNQGGTRVGSLVRETNSSSHTGHNLLSPRFSSHSGSSATGNMANSQIGGIQSAIQGGDTTNLQGNDQQQKAASYVGSVDSISNSATK